MTPGVEAEVYVEFDLMSKMIRRYRCASCGYRCSRTFAIEHADDFLSVPCPNCAKVPAPPPDRIAAPLIVGTKSRAVDVAYRIAEEDFGLTNMRDGMREGDTAFIPPPAPPVNVDPRTITRPTMLMGGAGSASSAASQLPGAAALLSNSKTAAAIAKAEGRNPMQLLHQGRPRLQAIPVNRE